MIDRTRTEPRTRNDGVTVTDLIPASGKLPATAVEAFDLLVETACELLDVDYVGVHLLAGDIHRVLASSDVVAHPPLLRSDSLCGVLLEGCQHPDGSWPLHIVEVPDTAVEPTLPFTTAVDGVAPVRFYAAAPLFDEHDRLAGSLCAISHHPRVLTPSERRTLLVLGLAASHLLQRCDRGLLG